MFFLELSWYQQCLVAHFYLTFCGHNNLWQFFIFKTICLCFNIC